MSESDRLIRKLLRGEEDINPAVVWNALGGRAERLPNAGWKQWSPHSRRWCSLPLYTWSVDDALRLFAETEQLRVLAKAAQLIDEKRTSRFSVSTRAARALCALALAHAIYGTDGDLHVMKAAGA